jgi:predicted ATPase/DNA-binding winged helix-turn-helix (wHTH) protein
MHSFGEFRLDAANQCVWRGDLRLSLAPRPFAVLRYLVENPHRLVTHDEMLDALWPDTYVLPQVLRTYVLELRKLLEDDPTCPRFIETVPKRGYRFLAPEADGAGSGIDHHSIVGRASELTLLCDRFAAAQRSERPTLFLTGEPGIGKTALIDEFCHCIRRKNASVRVARGQSIEGFAGKEKFYPVREALNGLFSTGDEKARTLLAPAAPSWFAPGSAPDPSVGQICEALESLSQNAPLLLVFEDIHWADDSTLDLIAALARRRAPAKLMLLVSFGSDDLEAGHSLRLLQKGLATGRRGEELHLGPLDREAIAEYLRREFKAGSIPAALTSLVHQHSSGNPLYMAAIVDYLLSQRIVSSDHGEVSVSQPIESIEIGVPPGLATVIRLRLDGLNEDDRRLLEAGSISGTIFPAWACAAALRRKLADVEEAYASLARRVRLLAVAGDDELPDGTRSNYYVFAHDLYRKAIYGEIPVSRRSQWHMQVADRLREMFAGNEASVAHEIAAHTRAGNADPA